MEKQVMDSLPQNLRSFVTVAEDGQFLRYRFADRVLFSSGEAEPEGLRQRDTWAAIGGAFTKQIGSFSRKFRWKDTQTIRRSTPPSSPMAQLGTVERARGTSVVRFLSKTSRILRSAAAVVDGILSVPARRSGRHQRAREKPQPENRSRRRLHPDDVQLEDIGRIRRMPHIFSSGMVNLRAFGPVTGNARSAFWLAFPPTPSLLDTGSAAVPA